MEKNTIWLFGKTFPVDKCVFYIQNKELFLEIISVGQHVYFRIDLMDFGEKIDSIGDLDQHRIHIVNGDVADDDTLDVGTGCMPTSGVVWAEKKQEEYEDVEEQPWFVFMQLLVDFKSVGKDTIAFHIEGELYSMDGYELNEGDIHLMINAEIKGEMRE